MSCKQLHNDDWFIWSDCSSHCKCYQWCLKFSLWYLNESNHYKYLIYNWYLCTYAVWCQDLCPSFIFCQRLRFFSSIQNNCIVWERIIITCTRNHLPSCLELCFVIRSCNWAFSLAIFRIRQANSLWRCPNLPNSFNYQLNHIFFWLNGCNNKANFFDKCSSLGYHDIQCLVSRKLG